MSELSMTRGDTRVLSATVTDADGTAVDISTADLRWTAKTEASDPDVDAVLVKTLGDGIELVGGGTEGELAITIEPADTDAFESTTMLLWDLQVTSGLGEVTTVDSGHLQVTVDISRTTP